MTRAMNVGMWMMLALLLVLPTGCSKRREAQQAPTEAAFWRWFIEHKDALASIKRADEPVANELAGQLHKLDPDLTFEIGGATPEMIVSAGGIRRAFPAVERVVKAAPAIPGWKVIAFRPRKPGLSIEMGDGVKVGPESLTFRVLGAKDGKLDVVVYVKGVPSLSDSVKQAVFLMLDATLGEYDVETRLGGIDMEPATAATAGARPFRELPQVVDAAR